MFGSCLPGWCAGEWARAGGSPSCSGCPGSPSVSRSCSGDTPRAVDPVAVAVGQLGLLAVNFALVNLWEESAWAGFLQSRLGQRHNLFVAALITAVPFAFAHWPLAFLGEVTVASVAVGLAAYLALGVIFRPMIGVFLQGTRGSVLAVAVLHSRLQPHQQRERNRGKPARR